MDVPAKPERSAAGGLAVLNVARLIHRWVMSGPPERLLKGRETGKTMGVHLASSWSEHRSADGSGDGCIAASAREKLNESYTRKAHPPRFEHVHSACPTHTFSVCSRSDAAGSLELASASLSTCPSMLTEITGAPTLGKCALHRTLARPCTVLDETETHCGCAGPSFRTQGKRGQ